jgi:BirA family biotin operon repressor/biotin-[acetyl-CoA-carboxylase] ligase
LSQRHIESALEGNPFIVQVIYRERIGSTNDLAKKWAAQGMPEGLLVIADEQSAGRGRLGRGWWAPPGGALLSSILFRPSLPASRAQQLTMLCALAGAEAVEAVTGLRVDLKWPNDLVLPESRLGESGWRKLAGVLTETGFVGDKLTFVVVGMGLNVNMNLGNGPELLVPATSLMGELGRPVDRLALLRAYLERVAWRYAQLKRGHSPHQEWADRLVTLGRQVSLRLDERRLEGYAEGVGEDGALLLRTSDGVLHRFHAADVSLR